MSEQKEKDSKPETLPAVTADEVKALAKPNPVERFIVHVANNVCDQSHAIFCSITGSRIAMNYVGDPHQNLISLHYLDEYVKKEIKRLNKDASDAAKLAAEQQQGGDGEKPQAPAA
jgi:hypothetical protein